MLKALGIGAAGALVLATMLNVARAADMDVNLADFMQPDGTLDHTALDAYVAAHSAAATDAKSRAAAAVPTRIVDSVRAAKSAGAGAATAKKPKPPGSSVAVLVRQDFSDLWLFADPTSRQQAKGAKISYSQNNVTSDTAWAVQGMAALALTIGGDYDSFLGLTVAPYVAIDRETHSNPKAKDVDTLAGGGSAEVGFVGFGGLQFLRGRVAAVSDQIKSTTSLAATAEWLPVYGDWCIGYPCAIPGTPLIFRFQPELEMQYDAMPNGSVSAFSGMGRSLRVGPAATLIMKSFGSQIAFFDKLSAKFTYHWDKELYSGKDYDWFDASLTYNIDPQGLVGVSAGYQRGNNEYTGAPVDLFTLALTAKY